MDEKSLRKGRKMILSYIIPIALQQALVSINFILDNIIVSRIGSNEIAALGSANKFLYIMRLSVIAFSIGNAVLSAQFEKSKADVGKTLFTSVISSLFFSLVFIVGYLTNRNFILSTFTNDRIISNMAGRYIDITIYSSLTLSVMLCFITTLRSLGSLMIPLFASVVGVLSNSLLSYLFIFKNSTRYGLSGAALSTILSEIIALVVLLAATAWRHPFLFKISNFRSSLGRVKTYLRMTLIVLASHLVWSLHTMIMHNLFGKLGAEELTAYGAILPVEAILFDIFSALAFATLIFVGRRLASDRKEEAYNLSAKVLRIGTMGGALVGLLLAIFSTKVASFYALSPLEARYVAILLRTLGLFMAVKIAASILVNGILRAGGDMTFILSSTILLAWGLIIPISYVGYNFFQWDLHRIYLTINASEIVTLALMIWRFRSKRWMRNLTRG